MKEACRGKLRVGVDVLKCQIWAYFIWTLEGVKIVLSNSLAIFPKLFELGENKTQSRSPQIIY